MSFFKRGKRLTTHQKREKENDDALATIASAQTPRTENPARDETLLVNADHTSGEVGGGVHGTTAGGQATSDGRQRRAGRR